MDVIPLEGSPSCPDTTTQFSQATSGLGLSGGLIEGIPLVCGEEGVDFVCHKLDVGANAWTPVTSGARFFEAAMIVYNEGNTVLAIGGR